VQKLRTNTRDEVTEDLETALAIVDELAPADELRVALFVEAARLLSHRTLVQEQGPPSLALTPEQMLGLKRQ
jgi:hypothetical protein